MQTRTIEQPAPSGSLSLEKCRHAARRMGVGMTTFYSIVKRGELRLVKVSERSSAVVASEVDSWIQKRIDAARGSAK